MHNCNLSQWALSCTIRSYFPCSWGSEVECYTALCLDLDLLLSKLVLSPSNSPKTKWRILTAEISQFSFVSEMCWTVLFTIVRKLFVKVVLEQKKIVSTSKKVYWNTCHSLCSGFPLLEVNYWTFVHLYNGDREEKTNVLRSKQVFKSRNVCA